MEVLSIRPRESLGRPANPFYLLHHMFCSSLPLYLSYSSFHIDSLLAKMISLWVGEDCHLRGPSWCCFVLQALLQAYWSHQHCKRFIFLWVIFIYDPSDITLFYNIPYSDLVDQDLFNFCTYAITWILTLRFFGSFDFFLLTDSSFSIPFRSFSRHPRISFNLTAALAVPATISTVGKICKTHIAWILIE